MQQLIRALALGLFLVAAVQASPATTLDDVAKLIEKGNLEQALGALESLPEESDESGMVSFHRARIHQRRGDYDRAEELIEMALEMDEGNASFHALKGAIHVGQINNAGFFSKMSLAGKIKDAFRRAVELDPGNVSYRENLMGYYLNAPGIAGGSTDRAREQAQAIAELDRGAGYRARLQIHLKEEELARAAAAFQEAIAEFPGDARLYALATSGFSQAEDYGNANLAVTSWRENLPNDAGALYQQGRLAAISGQYLEVGKAALKAYLKADREENDPPLHWANFRLGLVLMHQGDEKGAEARFALAREQGRDDEDLMEALADLD